MVHIIESGLSYKHGKMRPCSSDDIHPVILDVCRRHGAKRILDIGCGNGTLCRDLIDAGFSVVGMEPSASGIAAARELAPGAVLYTQGVFDDPDSIRENGFDAVVSTEVVEHLFMPSALPEFASAKLKPEGVLILSTPYHGYLKNLAIALAGKWDSHHSPWWDGGHIKFWSRKSLADMLSRHGFEVIEFHGVGRIPWLWKAMILVARKRSEGWPNRESRNQAL